MDEYADDIVLPMDKHDEQELSLLSEQSSDGDSIVISKVERPSNVKRTSWLRLNAKATLSSIFVLFILAIAIPLLASRNETSNGRESTNNDSENPTNYLISKDWNFNAKSTIREYSWTITDVELNPDGVYRRMMVVNGHFPGPMIEVNEGDTVVVHVNNQAENATSIHWHGLFQNGTNFMDGTVGITQCPIPPGTKFTYKFKVIQQYGTYWYHAHQGIQASDGLVGPLIIHSKEERDLEDLDYATDQVVMLSDHYHTLSSQLLMKYLASDNENNEPVPDGALINGRAIRDCSKFPSRRCDNTTSNVGIPRFHLEPNQRHKLRFINVGAFAEFQVAIDEHDFAVVEVDGTTVRPTYYNRFLINPAQRYSIVVETNAASSKSHWMRAKMLNGCFAERPKELDSEVWAIIDYSDAKAKNTGLPSSKEWDPFVESTCRDMNTTDLSPAKVISAPEKADKTFFLRANFEIGDWRLSRGVFNQSSWRPDVQSPSLFRTINGLTTSNSSFGPLASRSLNAFVNDVAFDSKRELVVQTSGFQVIDIVIINFDDGNHPLHLHGYKFFVLGNGHGYPPADLISTVDLSNPLRRDTASVEGYGWVHLRLVADNPGAWAFHCHISWHAEAGLLMQFLTRTDLLSDTVIPQANRDLCHAPLAELRKGASPDDKVFYGTPASQ